MGININDLNTSGASLLFDNESFLDNICDLSTEELKITGGGGHPGDGRGKGGSFSGGGSFSSGGGKGYFGGYYSYH